MSKKLIYSCVFFNDKYIDLIRLLLKSYKLFGDSSDDTDYLIICNLDFQKKIQEIFSTLGINGFTWCIDVKTMFESSEARLKIFNYPNIDIYNKILYLDCDILITNSLNKILDLSLENKLYALKENCHRLHHCCLFNDGEYKLLDKNCAFSTGILLFNNNSIIKDLFSKILLHITEYFKKKLPVPICLEQPFIIYNAVKLNLYDNQILINKVVNNPNIFQGETICHFPGGPGHYHRKIVKMSNFMNDIMFYTNKQNCIHNEYVNILNINKNHFDKLYTICKEIGEKIEGNCFTEHLNIDNKINELIYKQMNHYILGKNATNIMEIGFNAGHSSLLYLIANPNSKLTIFDICSHKYTIPCFEYLKSVFPNRLQIFPGDSTKTVPEYYINNPNKKFDLIHIDGAHFGDIPNKDFHNSLKLASDIIIWDDTQMKTLNDLFNGYINKGLVNEIFLYKTLVYEHRICRINKLFNKEYEWNNSTIKFLENGNMEAFGKGKYSYINKYLIKCIFDNNVHLLKFNEEYSKFISIRKGDFELISSNICFDTREGMIKYYSDKIDKPKILELGVFKGKFLDFMVNNLDYGLIDGVDLFNGKVCSGDQDGNNVEYVELESQFNLLNSEYRDKKNVNVYKSYTSSFLIGQSNDFYDIIYIDADHSYSGAKKDILLSHEKIKSGGYIMGHDYEMNMNKAKRYYEFGVRKAVDEYCIEFNQEIITKAMDGCVSFCIKVNK